MSNKSLFWNKTLFRFNSTATIQCSKPFELLNDLRKIKSNEKVNRKYKAKYNHGGLSFLSAARESCESGNNIDRNFIEKKKGDADSRQAISHK